jgi:hypothetical protein
MVGWYKIGMSFRNVVRLFGSFRLPFGSGGFLTIRRMSINETPKTNIEEKMEEANKKLARAVWDVSSIDSFSKTRFEEINKKLDKISTEASSANSLSMIIVVMNCYLFYKSLGL